MNKDVKRTIYLMLLAVIVFSASMSIPALYNSQWREPVQGGAAGLIIAAVLSVIQPIVRSFKNKA